MSEDDRVKWDRIHARGSWPAPAKVLTDYRHLLPHRGGALDLACGLGSNALLLAECGLTVEAWDISPVAIARLGQRARALGLDLKAQACDVTSKAWPQGVFDVIVVSRFLERRLCPVIQQALKPGGLLFYQTFVRDKVTEMGPSNPDFLLAENELLDLFQGLVIRVYREEGRRGDIRQGWRNEVCLVGEKKLEEVS